MLQLDVHSPFFDENREIRDKRAEAFDLVDLLLMRHDPFRPNSQANEDG